MDFQLFLPQMRMDLPTITQRCDLAVDSGFVGVALMDRPAPPLAENQPIRSP